MYQRDYMMRLIQQFSEAMVKVMFQRRNRQFAEAMELLVQAMQRLLGLNSKMVQALAVKDIIALLSMQGRLDAGKGLLLADMLKAEGELLMDAGDERAGQASCMKALELLLEMRWMEETADLRDEVDSRIVPLLDATQKLRKSKAVLALLLGYYDSTGMLSKAEDTLFFMLEEDQGDPAVITQGLEMYERWLKLDVSAVEQGNLTRDELEESYEILIKMKQNGSSN
ncbi:DUF6483 family protein [Paenibacillus rigui]|uniref:Uncharacterized protein n=1 Tax=Paenibacillus rigui TaxID=554312 RepID=A0A229USN7_9BACL|nr:DUF6483 family protein [Paenibacillus rigui]OXM86438.1 hypothetical protein CF651_10940 [Paenibacillus rigui]